MLPSELFVVLLGSLELFQFSSEHSVEKRVVPLKFHAKIFDEPVHQTSGSCYGGLLAWNSRRITLV